MSGLKRALLLLRRSARSADLLPISQPVTDGLELDHHAYLLASLEAAENRQWFLDSALQDHHPVLAHLEQEIGRELLDIQSDLVAGLSDAENKGLGALEEQAIQFKGLLDHQNLRLDELQSTWQANIWRVEDQVREILQSTRTISAFISETYPEAPLTHILSMISLAEEGLADHAGQAALVWAQQAFSQSITLRTQLEIDAIEFSHWLGVALYHLDLLDSTINANQNIPACDTEGKELDTWIDVDAWVNGRLNQLSRTVNALRLRLQTPSPLSLQELKHLVEHHCPELHQRLIRLLDESRQAVIAAQMRVNIADLVITALTRQGYEIQSAGFSDGDMRRQYDLTLENQDGGTVEIHVIPLSSKSPRHELVLDSRNDAVRSEHELHQRANEILTSLRHYGISIQDLAEERPVQWGEQSVQIPVQLCPLPASL